MRPQILQATKAKPPRMMAPPTPTTTPMTVLRVCVDMPDGEVFFPARVPVAVLVCWLVKVVCCPSAPVVVTTVVMVVRISEAGGSDGPGVGSGGGVVG